MSRLYQYQSFVPRAADMHGRFEPALSRKTMQIVRWAEDLENPVSPSRYTSDLEKGGTLEERLFNAVARAMIALASVGMHLDKNWREMLFRQLNSLHDAAEWYEGDEPLREASFRTFLKAILQIRPKRRPGLGLSSAGNLIAAWTRGRDQLTIEFLPHDKVRWVLSRHYDDEPERFAASISVARLIHALQPYDLGHWFSGEDREE